MEFIEFLLLFALGAVLGFFYFSTVALSLFYGFPKALLWSVRRRCHGRLAAWYLGVAVLWIAIFLAAAIALAAFWPSALRTLQESAGFNFGSLLGFWGSVARAAISRSAREDLRLDFLARVANHLPRRA